MAIELIDKIKQKNNGNFKLVDAVDVEMQDGKDVESAIGRIDETLKTHIENHPSVGADLTIHVGEEEPQIQSIKAWVDTSDNEEFMQDVADSVLDEFREIFNSMQNQISTLKAKTTELEARIYYLELHGGGIGPSNPAKGEVLALEDGTILTLEDGTILTFE